jgi:hypothetical protein
LRVHTALMVAALMTRLVNSDHSMVKRTVFTFQHMQIFARVRTGRRTRRLC